MARVSTYLNFMGQTEEAFAFYASVFGTEIESITRFSDMQGGPDTGQLPEAEQGMVMNAAMPILAGHIIMGTDMLESMGHATRIGNNTTINLEPDSLEELERLYAGLSDGASESTGLSPMPWGAMWGTCLDRYGVRWMFNCQLDESARP